MKNRKNKQQQYKSVDEYEKEFCLNLMSKNLHRENSDYEAAKELAKLSLNKHLHILASN